MSAYREIFTRLFVHALVAAPFFAAGLMILFREKENPADVYGGGLQGCACIILGAMILARPLARLLAEPFGNLFWSDEKYDRPQPLYSVPQAKRMQGLYAEALAGFEKITRDYPDEVRAYIAMVDIAIVDLRDEKMAAAICRNGLAKLEKDEDKQTLARMYNAIRSRLKGKEKEGRAHFGC